MTSIGITPTLIWHDKEVAIIATERQFSAMIALMDDVRKEHFFEAAVTAFRVLGEEVNQTPSGRLSGIIAVWVSDYPQLAIFEDHTIHLFGADVGEDFENAEPVDPAEEAAVAERLEKEFGISQEPQED